MQSAVFPVFAIPNDGYCSFIVRHSTQTRTDRASSRQTIGDVDMTDLQTANVLVQGTRAQSSSGIVAPPTYPMGRRPGGDSADLSAHLDAICTEFAAGNVARAIRGAHFVSGHSARTGNQRIASVVRKAVRAYRLGDHAQAHALLSKEIS